MRHLNKRMIECATDTTFVNVTDQSALCRTLDNDFLHNTVLDDRNARLGRGNVDKDFFAHKQMLSDLDAGLGEELRRFKQR